MRQRILWFLVPVLISGSVAFALTDAERREGDQLAQSAAFGEAAALYRAALARDANDVEARYRLVNVLVFDDKIAEAATHVEFLADGQHLLGLARSGEEPRPMLRAAFATSGPDEPNTVVFSAAVGWGEADAAAALDWILSLPVGIARDWALAGLARGMANVGHVVTPTALSAFSNDRTRQERLLFVIPTLARYDASGARTLIDTYITDPDIRERVERVYERALDSTD